MNKIVFITTEDAEFGFELTGALQYIAEQDNFVSTLKSTIADTETGLVIVDERLINSGNEEEMRAIEHMWQGILIVLPSPERPETELEDYASRLIRRAIGYHVRLKL